MLPTSDSQCLMQTSKFGNTDMAVSIIDYGASNLLSVVRALRACGQEAEIVSSPDGVEKAKRLILPGVGAFGACMNGLRELQLVEPIQKAISAGRPFLGICVGCQVLFDEGLEFGTTEGLGIIAGKVQPIPECSVSERSLKRPHIGWAPLEFPAHQPVGQRTILDRLPERNSTYFLHSFHAVPSDETSILATARYGGHDLTAAVRKDNVVGCQFHPEKSGDVGLAILRNFLSQQ